MRVSLLSVTSLNCPLVQREAESLRPLYPREHLFWQVFWGKTGDSGHSSGLDREAILGFHGPVTNVFPGSLGKGSQNRDQG